MNNIILKTIETYSTEEIIITHNNAFQIEDLYLSSSLYSGNAVNTITLKAKLYANIDDEFPVYTIMSNVVYISEENKYSSIDSFKGIKVPETGKIVITIDIPSSSKYGTVLNIYLNVLLRELLSGGGGVGDGRVTIFNDSELISNEITKIDFKGSGVLAKLNDEDNSKIDLFIPPPKYSSNFNTSNGTTNGLVNESLLTLQQRNVANPIEDGDPYIVSDWYDFLLTNKYPSSNKNIFEVYCNQAISVIQGSIFTITINDGNSDLIDEVSFQLNGNGTFIENGVTMIVTNFATEDDKWKCNIRFRININSYTSVNKLVIVITHNNLADGFFSYNREYFYDTDTIYSSIEGVDVPLPGTYNTKVLSGITSLTTGTIFTIPNITINNLLKYTYLDTPMIINSVQLASSNININRALLGITMPANNIFDNTFNITNLNLPININNVFIDHQNNKNLIFTEYDWVTRTAYSHLINKTFLIDTLTSTSNRITEDFRHESFRLNDDFSIYNSEESLIDNNGLQCYNSRLIYPTKDFSSYFLNDDRDYSTIDDGARMFLRKFWHTGINHSNGILKFEDHNITEEDLQDGNVSIEISLDGTDWYNLGIDFLTAPLSDGDGCRIFPGVNALNINNKLQFSLGYGVTDESNDWGIFIKITYLIKNKYIGKIILEDWN